MRLKPSRSKYRNIKTVVDGITFDSKKEARRYRTLNLLKRALQIHSLKYHPVFELRMKNQLICKYEADFAYNDRMGNLIVEDVKSSFTKKNPVYRLKKKMMFAEYGIEIKEV